MDITPQESDILCKLCKQYARGLITQDQFDQTVCELLNLSQAEVEKFDITPYWPIKTS